MAKRAYNSQFYAEDKDIFDLLASQQRGISLRRLLQFARERGIFLSESDLRDKTIRYISQLPLDWTWLSRLLEMTETPDRTEKTTSSALKTVATLDAAENAAHELRSERDAERDEVYTIKKAGNDLLIQVQYTEIDESKTRLNQRRTKRITVRTEKTPDGIKFRHEANERANEIVKALISEIDEATGTPASRQIIELSGIKNPGIRTKFFIDLMQGVKGLKLSDVSSVSVDRIPTGPDDSLDKPKDDEEAEDIAPARSRSQATVEAANMMGVVRSVLLKGQLLLQSQEYQQLTQQGFFISRAVWTADQAKSDGVRVEFEAEFDDGPNAKDFRYTVRGVYDRKRDGELKKTRESVKESDKGPYMLALEDAAQRAIEKAKTYAASPTAPLLAADAPGK